jgi:hypothetical protein
MYAVKYEQWFVGRVVGGVDLGFEERLRYLYPHSGKTEQTIVCTANMPFLSQSLRVIPMNLGCNSGTRPFAVEKTDRKPFSLLFSMMMSLTGSKGDTNNDGIHRCLLSLIAC